MNAKRSTVTLAATALLCSSLILVSWAQSRHVQQGTVAQRSSPAGFQPNATGPRPEIRTAAADEVPPTSGALLALSGSYDVTPSRGLSDVVTGDFNGDGKLDMALVNPCNVAIAACPANGQSGWIAVLLGNGNGTFAAPVLYSSVTFSPNAIVAGDFNGDGRLDLAFSSQCPSYDNCATGAVSVMLGNGDGSFQSPVTYVTAGSGTNAIAVGQVNGDGFLDLVTSDLIAPDHSGGSASVLIGNGDGTFQAPISYSSSGALTAGVTIADCNGDGYADVVLTNVNGTSIPGSISVLVNNGDGTFGPAAS
jgi:hypothetical protein